MTMVKEPEKTHGKQLRLEMKDNGVALLTLDVPGEKVNSLGQAGFTELEVLLNQLEAPGNGVRALVLTSGKPDSFVVGADIRMISAIKTAAEGEALSRAGQQLFNRIEELPFPTVVAINGPCLGGGLELALAFRYRMVSDDNNTQLGLPETQLGIIPGAGGTQRLPRLVGLRSALEMILPGKRVRPRSALKMGLVNEIVPKELLVQRALVAAARIADETERKGRIPLAPASKRRKATSVDGLLLEATVAGRALIYQKAKAGLLAKAGKHYPAVYKALDAVFYSRSHSLEEGLAYEARLFGELAVSDACRSLVSIFFATTALKNERYTTPDGDTPKPHPVSKVGVLGGGLMGGGIATTLIDKGVRVRVKDRDLPAASKALAYADKYLSGKVKRRHIRPYEKDMKKGLLSATDDYSGFRRANVVIEAVFEDLNIKHTVLREVEAVTGRETVFATNTSSIPIKDIAAASSHPETVVGMHFFSPVEKMPLLEVIVTPQTAGWAASTIVALGKKMGKHVIVVNDGPGFYTSRALGAMMNEAIKILIEGASVEAIDGAMRDLGFPVGPMTLIDEVGFDVAQKVLKTLLGALGDRFQVPPEATAFLATGRMGRKNKKGFYRYDLESKKKNAPKVVDETVYETLPGGKWRTDPSPKIIQDRCLYAFLNEAAHIMHEGVLRSARDGDIGAVFGLGFPAYMGGPFRHMDRLGLETVVARLNQFKMEYSRSFEPCPLLVEMRDEKRTFHASEQN